MRRAVTAVVLFIVVATASFAQEKARARVEYEEWGSVYRPIMAEEWGDALEAATGVMGKYAETGDEADLATLRFIMIFIRAGLVVEGKLTHAELVEQSSPFIGKRVTAPALPFAERDGGVLNRLSIDTTRPDQLFVSLTDNQGFHIHCMLRATPRTSLASAPRDGVMRVSGILRELQPNPNGSSVWIVRTILDDAVLVPKD